MIALSAFAAGPAAVARRGPCSHFAARAHFAPERVIAAPQQRHCALRRRDGAAVCSARRIGMTVVLSASSSTTTEAENALLSVLSEVRGRGAGATPAQEQAILKAIYDLENDGGMKNPVDTPEIDGEWKLLYTSKSRFDPRNPLGARVDGTAPGLEGIFTALFGQKKGAEAAAAAPVEASSSPIQRSITGNDSFTVTQDVSLKGPDARVDNVVVFGDVGVLRLTADASVPSGGDRRRVNFAFSGGYVQLKAFPVKIPYPVPFKLLGDEAKGWLDTTYLSPRLRISRGNKGTTFVLAK